MIGSNLPSLTYMLVFADMAAREKSWATFREDPEWVKLRTTPGYSNAEVLTNITNLFLRPTDYSQIFERARSRLGPSSLGQEELVGLSVPGAASPFVSFQRGILDLPGS